MISVLTFNILADCYVRVSGQPWNAFAHCKDEDLDASNRMPKIVRLLLESKADVICLQEVVFEKRMDSALSAELWSLPAWTDLLISQGYTGVMQGLSQKEWDKSAQRNEKAVGKATPTGVATFYRSDLWHEAEPSKHGSGSGSVLFLQSRQTPELLVAVGNTHLVGDPSKFDAHLRQLGGVLKNMASQPRFVRVICGDFNSECAVGSEVADWIADNGLRDLPLGGSTWAEPGRGLRLDHILYQPQRFTASTTTQALPEEDIASGLPNARWPSDHIPFGAALSLLPAGSSE